MRNIMAVWLVVVGALLCITGTTAQKDSKRLSLFAHNKARSQHVDTPDLTWDENLVTQAKRHANKLLLKNYYASSSNYILDHSTDNVGENVYIGNHGEYSDKEKTVADAVRAWYAEGIDYNYYQIAPFGRYWHFTQVVWKSTTKVGCGWSSYVKHNRRHTVIVCQYLPKGNISIGFRSNVKQLKSGGKSYLTTEELTPPRVIPKPGEACPYTDTGVPGACTGMKPYCNDPALKSFLHSDCQKTCFC